MQDVMFIDFEASGLADGSWPIEVGLSWIDKAGRAHSWASLICPAVAWSASLWADQSAAVHGIARADLDAAPTAAEVAREVMRRSEGMRLVSDAPEFDQRWLDMLLTFGATGERLIEDFDEVTLTRFDETTLDWIYEALARMPVPHRAGPDSLRMAEAWLRGKKRALGSVFRPEHGAQK